MGQHGFGLGQHGFGLQQRGFGLQQRGFGLQAGLRFGLQQDLRFGLAHDLRFGLGQQDRGLRFLGHDGVGQQASLPPSSALSSSPDGSSSF